MNIKKVLIAPDSFKECISAKEACIAIENGIKRVDKHIECIHVPMADGGEGTTQSLVDATGGAIYKCEVCGPMGDNVIAVYGILGDKKTAVIEMAEASGLHLVKREFRNPTISTSYGTGELIRSALDNNVEKIIIGLGGSATNDAGIGMLQALGVSFKDNNGNELGFGGGEISKLQSIDISNLDNRLENVKIEVACDVKNYLTGENGASYVFGPQKGATSKMIEVLDNNLKYFSNIVKLQFGKEIDKIQGAGAAGGLGAALIGFLKNVEVKRGIDLVIEYTNLEDKVKDVDIVITGEGSIDFQTKFGKTPIGVANISKRYDKPVIAFAGKVGDRIDELYDLGIKSVIGIVPSVVTLEDALKDGAKNLEISVENIFRILKI